MSWRHDPGPMNRGSCRRFFGIFDWFQALIDRSKALPTTFATANGPGRSSSHLDALETPSHQADEPAFLGWMDHETEDATTSYEDSPDAGVLFRHSGWAPQRRCVLDALLDMDGAAARRDRLLHCGSHSWVMQSVDDPAHYRIACNKCRDRFCSPCARDRANHVANAVSLFARDREIRLITLTLRKSDATLKADVDRLYRCFAKLRRRKTWTQSQTGGIYFCEIKRRRGDDGWHTHLHALSEGVWLDVKWLRREWHKITGDSFIVDIRECRSSADAARYAAKYASKGVHGSCYFDALVLREAMLAIKGRRLVSKYGNWADLDLKTDEATGEWLTIDTLESLIRKCRTGDTNALAILNSIRSPSCQPTERSPPAERGQSLSGSPENHGAPAVASGFNLAS